MNKNIQLLLEGLFDDVYDEELNLNKQAEVVGNDLLSNEKHTIYVPELNKNVTYFETEPTTNKTNYIKLKISSYKKVKGDYIQQEDIKYILKTECFTLWSGKMSEFIYNFVRKFIKRNLNKIDVYYYDTEKNDWYNYMHVYKLYEYGHWLLNDVPDNVKKNYKFFIEQEKQRINIY